MSEKGFWGETRVSGSTKGGHSKLRGQPFQRHVSAWWRCLQKGQDDLVQLNGWSGSSEHLVWGHIAQQDRSEQTMPYQCSHPIFLTSSSSSSSSCHYSHLVTNT